MQRVLITFVMVLFLTACASPQQKAQIAEFKSWQTSRLAQAKIGQVQWSVYYAELWTRLSQMPDDPQKPQMMATTAELIPLARRYEAGQISKDQFEDSRRILVSRASQEQQTIQQRQQAINDAQAEQLYRLGNQIMQPRNPTTNCLTTKVGPNTLSTNCN
jgi:hypothetical protein